MISYEAKRIRLRPIRKSDLEITILWRNDLELQKYALGIRFPVTERMEEKWYESIADDPSRTRVVFAIEMTAQSQIIGITHLNQIDWISRLAYFGILIGDSKYRGMGIGGEAMDILFRYAFDCLNLRKICLQVVEYNESALRLYRKFGFQEEGRLREQYYLEGQHYDIIMMALFADDFRNRGA